MSKTPSRATRTDESGDSPSPGEVLQALRATPEVFAAITAGPDDELALQRELRKSFPDELVRGALQLAELRKRGAAKFARAAQMWFDRVGLEQATGEVVARHKAERFSGGVDDLCCGIGGDAIALARDCGVRAVDQRPPLTLMTQWNSEVYDVARNLEGVTGDAGDFVAGERLVHLDPDRRTGSRRSVRIEDYRPGRDFMDRLIESRPGGAIKLSPASNFGGKFPGCEIELVSLHGECKEAVVWFGTLAGYDEWRATVLPSGETIAGDPLSAAACLSPAKAFVYDPDPAVVRSGLLDVVACHLGLDRLDDADEYLTGDSVVASDFVTPFRVLDELPNNDKQVRRYFREHDFGAVEIKCRHVRVNPDTYRRKLTHEGTQPVTLIFARIDGRTRVLVCTRLPRPHR